MREKKYKQIVLSLAIMLICFGMAATKQVTAASSTVKVSSVSISAPKIYVSPGETIKLTATTYPSNATNKGVYWEEYSSYATIDSDGYLTISSSCPTSLSFTVYAYANDGYGARDSIKIYIRHPKPVFTAAYNMSQSGTRTIKLSWNKVGTDIVYRSVGNPNNFVQVARTQHQEYIDYNVEEGQTYYYKLVRVETSNIINDNLNSVDSDIVSVTVPVLAKRIDVECNKVLVTDTIQAVPGEKLQFSASVWPDNTGDKTVKWSVYSGYATTSSNGVLTISNSSYIGGTKFPVIFEAADGSGIKKIVYIYVKKAVASIDLSDTNLSLNVNGTKTLKATCMPSDAYNRKLTFSSSNSKVATVTSSGTIKGIAPGTCTIYVKTSDGSVVENCKVTVKTPSLNKTKATMYPGETLSLKAENYSGTVTWSSSNKSIATVLTSGKIKAVKKGTAVITAKMGKKEVKCTVTVNSTALEKKKASIVTGLTTKLSIKGSYKKAVWSSSNKKVVTVTSKGVVKGVSKGTAKITVTIDGKKHTCTVTVKTNERTVSGSTNVWDFDWGTHMTDRKYYYEGNKLVYECNILNRRSYNLDSIGRMTITVVADGTTIAKQTFSAKTVNIKPNSYKKVRITFTAKSTLKTVDLTKATIKTIVE